MKKNYKKSYYKTSKIKIFKYFRYILIAIYFIIFLYAVFGIRFYPIVSFFHFSPRMPSVRSYNLNIWQRYSDIETLNEWERTFLDIDFWGNVLMFIPFPYAIHYLFGVERWWKLLLSGIFTSIVVEFLQFVFKIGIADINDVLTNTLGTDLGFLLLYGWKSFVKIISRK